MSIVEFNEFKSTFKYTLDVNYEFTTIAVEVVEESSRSEEFASVTTTALLASTAITLATGGSMAQIWEIINGMQFASYLPLINIEFPENAGEFSSKIAAVVTFEIPGLDLDLLGEWIECPEDEAYLFDIREETISDQTKIEGIRWGELKNQYLLDPYFDS